VGTGGLAIALAAGVPRAGALSVSVPLDVPRSMDVTVTMAASDPTGTVMLVVDGAVVCTAAGDTGAEVGFPAVQMRPGYHRVRAGLRFPSGIVRSGEQVRVRVWGVPGRPKMLNPPAGYAGKSVSVRARAGSSTSSMTLSVNGKYVRTVACQPGSSAGFGTVYLPKGTSTFSIVSENPFGERASYSYRVRRLIWPWATCIVIDKSQFRLYWVRNGALVKTYRIAIGKPSTPTPSRTWKILSKERTDPHGVFGPRKLRLYKQSGSGWLRTGYGIHGTNEPWVIGTMASHGCIRLTNSDILELWPQVPYGTMVQTRP
jgi:lipoprotein-anchoring transpeptidase ErfK/SrfK